MGGTLRGQTPNRIPVAHPAEPARYLQRFFPDPHRHGHLRLCAPGRFGNLHHRPVHRLQRRLHQFPGGAPADGGGLLVAGRGRPLLRTGPADLRNAAGSAAGKRSPGGPLRIAQRASVCFRYAADGPLILDGVALAVEPGEFVAVVGSSGSGKSTLLRLLLGFEAPEAGTVYYDRRDLATLNVREVRRQIGVVLQNGGIMAGSIFQNIVGTTGMNVDAAWEAAEMVGLKEDLEALPQAMHTLLDPGGFTLSGGQRQRLLIARAIVRRPRLLFFDEATSALDNRTQALVSHSLERLQATRLVIAHRLSTIEHADRILVMDRGRIVEQGTYRELLDSGGWFTELARRQIA
ncbi:MAG: hypothetical protein COT06_08520 [Syntrophobacteraceae bacterium CG07_land_8_20_14_0_80_61_8]|nr:MAG: hypothetical protein COT06_08520 [Syntrophobacteraceae bacterium CG07_land_8_20_14_0_80_61_8]